MFAIYLEAAKTLKAFSATSRNGKHILKIEVEYDRALDMSFDVDALEELSDQQKAQQRQAASRKRTARSKRAKQALIGANRTLALPSPRDFDEGQT